MAILSRPRLIAQERFDLEDFNALLSALRTDSKLWTRQFLSGENYILKGFTVSGLGLNAATIEMDNATLILSNNSNDFSYFVAEDSPTDVVVSDGDLVDNARNYVELQLVTENNTPVVKAFWDPSANGGQGQEFNQEIDTMTDLSVQTFVSQGGFSGSPDRVPLAIIDTDATGVIKVILDQRPLYFRLGSATDPNDEFTWASQEEPHYNLTLTGVSGTFTAGETITIGGGVTATVVTGGTSSITMRLPNTVNFSSGDAVAGAASGATGTLDTVLESFTGADKDVDDFRESLSAIMTEIKRIKGTDFWYQTQNNSLQGISQYINSQIVGITTNARYSWSGTEFTITDDNGTPADADVVARIRLFGRGSDIDLTRQDGNGGSSTIPVADGEVVFVTIPSAGNVTFSGAGAGATNYQVADIADYVVSDENYWIAYREGGNLYVRGYGELQTGEEAQISDPVTAQILTFIGAVDETDSDPNYPSATIVTQGGSLVNSIGELDASLSGGISNSNQDRTLKLVRGGTWNWTLSSNQLSWSADAFLQVAGLAEDVNEISAGNVVLANDGDVAYVQVKRTAGASTLSVSVGSISSLSLTDNIVILARRVGNDVLVGASFLLKDGEYLELDGALAEINRQLGQLKLRAHESDANKARIDSSDITQLDGSILSRVIGDFLLSFSGAVINFTTGAVLQEDDSTPLGVDFTPQVIPASEYFWYGISLLPGSVGADNRQLAQVQVDLADASNAVEASAPNAIMSGDIKLGNVLVQNNGGNVEIQKVFRLGPGSGSGSGGAGADAEGDYKRRLDLSPFNFVSPTIFELDKDAFLDGSSTGSYSPGDRAFQFDAIGSTMVSTQSFDTDYLDDSKSPNWAELIVKWKDGGIDTAATYEVSRNGGNEWQAITMERVGLTDTYRGIHNFATEATLQSLSADATTDGDTELNGTATQALSQSFTVTGAQDVREVEIDVLVTGSPQGNIRAKIVADDTGAPSTDPLDVLSFTNLINIQGLSTGVQTINFGNKVLPAGTYHIVLETDDEYKANFSAGVTSISLRVNSGGSGASVFDGTSWSAANGLKFDIKGISLDLRVRITSSVADVFIDDYGVFYDKTPGVTADGELGVDTFEFSGDENRIDFTLQNINNPHPDLLVCYDVFRGQTYVANEGVFRIEGQLIRFDADFFDDPGENIRLKFVQVRGAAFDTSDANANNIASIFNNLIDLGDQIESVSDSMVVSKIPVPFSEITNRAEIIDLSMDLKPRFGIDRMQFNQIFDIENEFGPDGQAVYGLVNDKFGQFRAVGEVDEQNTTLGSYLRVGTSTSDFDSFAEFTFWGTGLNLLYLEVVDSGAEIFIDGVSQGTVSFATVQFSTNYNVNRVLNVASGLTPGMHTVRVKKSNINAVHLFGVEVLNEEADIQLPPGAQLFKGKRLVKNTHTTTPYNTDFESGTLGTRGGHVAIYQKADGSVAKAVTPTDATALYLGAANHTNEEIIDRFNWRAFGDGGALDFSTLDNGSNDDRGFAMSDGTTTLFGNNVQLENNNTVALVNSGSSFVTIQFVGTGLDIIQENDTGSARNLEVFVDGVSQGNISLNVRDRKLQKICSGLPYGTHTVKFLATNANSGYIQSFLVYGPKAPSIPAGAKQIGNYFLMADFVANPSIGANIVSQGVLAKNSGREIIYGGTGWTYSPNANGDTERGPQVFSDDVNATMSYTFFGTGFDMRFVAKTNYSNNISVELDDGSGFQALTTTNFGTASFSTAGSGVAYNSGTGTLDQQATSLQAGSSFVCSGLPLGTYTVRFTNNVNNFFMLIGNMDIITPVHVPKKVGPFVLQNELYVGSQAIGDLRKFSSKDIPMANYGQRGRVEWKDAALSVGGGDTIYFGTPISFTLDKPSFVNLHLHVEYRSNIANSADAYVAILNSNRLSFRAQSQSHDANRTIDLDNSKRIFLGAGTYTINMAMASGSTSTHTYNTNRWWLEYKIED